MCGIAGIVGSEVPTGAIQRMTAAIAHRGPDAEGYFQDGPVHLGHRRLSILDTSARGNQPMQDPTGRYVLIHNGEIYNFKQVRATLGFSNGTETDTEVILAAYIKWGPACLARFAGMWAFAIWDREEQSLFIARDRLGIKPIYVCQQGEQLMFASEIRAILRSGLIQPKINRAALAGFWVYQTVYGLDTMVEGIQMIPPGHCGIWKAGRWTVTRWWNIWENASPEAQSLDAPAIRGRIRSLLDQSIARRLVSDVPVGAFLSGGIDSSVVVALMAQASTQPVDTFSIEFAEKEYDESHWSRLIAKQYATRHHPILLQPADFLAALPAALASMDHPSGDGINSYVVSQVTRAQGVKVALSGLGGDELFAGYPVFTQLPAITARGIFKIPAPVRKMLAALYRALQDGREAHKKAAVLGLPQGSLDEVYKVYRTIYEWDQACKLFGLPSHTPHPLDGILSGERAKRLALPPLSQISGLEIGSYTQSVLLRDADQMSMAHALEVRVPFFDHDLVEFVMGIPDHVKRPGFPKQLLVESVPDLLPHDLVHRKKMGFVLPWEQWLRGPLRELCDQRLQQFAERGLLQEPNRLQKTWKDFLAGQGPWLWTHIWLPVIIEDWMQRNGVQA